VLLDTSAIIEIFRRSKSSIVVQSIMKELPDEDLYLSSVQIAEIADWHLRNGLPAADGVSFAKKIANLIPLDEAISVEAAKIKFERRKKGQADFGLIDGIILASARSVDQKLLTFDPHFIGENDCIVLGQD
jgi:predicted nucleic acid-binding protein